jgi:hypothetical protein
VFVELVQALQLYLKKALPTAHPGLGADLLFRASAHSLGQIEVLPGVRRPLEWSLAADTEHRTCSEVDKHNIAQKVRGEHALIEVV